MDKTNSRGRTELHNAAEKGSITKVDSLIRSGANVNARTKHRWTALMLAAEKGFQPVVKSLLDHGADVNAAADGGTTALHKAASLKDSGILDLLLDRNTEPNPIDSKKRTPLTIATVKGYTRNVHQLLLFGGEFSEPTQIQEVAQSHSEKTRNKIIEELRKGLGLDGCAAQIHWAVENGSAPAVRRMLAKNPELIRERNTRGWFPLHRCARDGNAELTELLLKANADVNCLTKSGWTPLLLAAEKKRESVLKCLVKYNAKTTVRPKKPSKVCGMTAVDFVQQAGCSSDIIDLLSQSSQNEKTSDHQQLEDQEDEQCTNAEDLPQTGGFDGKLLETSESFQSLTWEPPYLKELSKTYEDYFQYSEGDRIIKVAVLDSGIRLDHPDFEQPRVKTFGKDGKPIRNHSEPAQRRRIKGVRNFAKKLQQDENDVSDLSGHGTQVAGLILRFAPMAELYIARVCDGELKQTTGDFDLGPREDSVEQAIQWAIEQKVDIINMSFGFDKIGAGGLVRALRNATGSDKLVFAAMSNGGLFEPRRGKWPARERFHVIGIHSSTTEGHRSEFTPLPVPHKPNFMLPGERIPVHSLQGSNFEHVEGTSFATPIGAAIAALILAYVHQRLCKKEAKEEDVDLNDISNISGMVGILEHISREDSGYLAIPPTLFWDRGQDQRKVRKKAWQSIVEAIGR